MATQVEVTTFDQVKNRVYSKLAAAITAGATSLTVTLADAGLFPDIYPYHLTLDDEIVKVTNRVSNTLTIVRAQQDTTAAAHANKTYVALNITAKSVSDLNAAVNTIEQALEMGIEYLKIYGQADYPLDMMGATVNTGGADIRLSQQGRIDNTTHDLVRISPAEGSKTTHYFEVGEPISTIKGTFVDLNLTQALRFTGTGKNIDGEVVFRDKVTVGRPAGGGVDFILYGAVANYRVMWDANGDTNGRWTFGDNDYGVDVAFRGATTGVSMLWDASADSLVLTLAKMTQAWTTTEATAGEQGFKITVTDSVVQSAGYIQSLLIDHNITGAKSGSAQNESISVDMNIGANVVYAYPIAVYVSKTSNPNIDFLAGMQVYLEDMGSGTLGGIAGLDIQIGSTNLGARHTGIRLVSHTGTARSGILFEKAWTVGIDFSGTGSGGVPATFSTADIRFQGGTTLLDDGTDLTLAGANLVVPQLSMGDDLPIVFGGVASLLWETADADANMLVLALANGGAVDSPTLMIGDQSVLNFDLGTIIDLSALDEPNIVFVDADTDTYIAFGLHADDTPHIHTNRPLRIEVSGDTDDYFKFETDTGVPTIFAEGSYLRIGDAKFTQHSLDCEDDLMVSGEFEVSGASFFDALVTISPIAAANSHLLISGTAKLNANEQALYINFPSETVATNGIWITLGSDVTSGDLTGIRSRVTGNATSSGANVRGAYLEAKVGAGKYAAMLEGALIHADYSQIGAGTISGDVRGLTVHISQGTGLTAANLYGILLNIQTRGNESITTDDVGLMIRNQAVGGNGRTMDSAIKIAGLNMGGGTSPFTYDIVFSGGQGISSSASALTMPAFTLGGTVTVNSQTFDAGSGYLDVDTTGSVAIHTDKSIFVGDTANTKMTIGLTLNQGYYDDDIISLKSADVAHPFTAITEADTYGAFKKSEASYGGLIVSGFMKTGRAYSALSFIGYVTDTVNTIKTTAAQGAFRIAAYKSDGSTSVATLGANENIAIIANGALAKFVFDADGHFHCTDTVCGLGEGGAATLTGGEVRAPHIVAGGTNNQAGADLTIAAGKGTGTGDVGQIIFQTPRVGASGNSLQTLTTIMTLDENLINLSGYLVLYNTDTDSAVEGAMWFSETDKTIEYFNGTDVKIVQTTAGISFLPEERVMFGHRWELGDIGLVKIDEIKPNDSPHGLLYPFNRALAEAEEILAIKRQIASLEDRLAKIGG